MIPCSVCTSESADRDEVLLRFREQKNAVIFATTVLERGVTVERADICVFHAENRVFDTASLIQMAGRAGRSFRYPEGDVLFLCAGRSQAAEECERIIRRANAS